MASSVYAPLQLAQRLDGTYEWRYVLPNAYLVPYHATIGEPAPHPQLAAPPTLSPRPRLNWDTPPTGEPNQSEGVQAQLGGGAPRGSGPTARAEMGTEMRGVPQVIPFLWQPDIRLTQRADGHLCLDGASIFDVKSTVPPAPAETSPPPEMSSGADDLTIVAPESPWNPSPAKGGLHPAMINVPKYGAYRLRINPDKSVRLAKLHASQPWPWSAKEGVFNGTTYPLVLFDDGMVIVNNLDPSLVRSLARWN